MIWDIPYIILTITLFCGRIFCRTGITYPLVATVILTLKSIFLLIQGSWIKNGFLELKWKLLSFAFNGRSAHPEVNAWPFKYWPAGQGVLIHVHGPLYPSPRYPVSQTHAYEPSVLMQSACRAHGFLATMHSFLSSHAAKFVAQVRLALGTNLYP